MDDGTSPTGTGPVEFNRPPVSPFFGNHNHRRRTPPPIGLLCLHIKAVKLGVAVSATDLQSHTRREICGGKLLAAANPLMKDFLTVRFDHHGLSHFVSSEHLCAAGVEPFGSH